MIFASVEHFIALALGLGFIVKNHDENSRNVYYLKYTIRSIVCEASCYSVTRSFGHSVTWSLGHLVTWSLGHSVIPSLDQSVTIPLRFADNNEF